MLGAQRTARSASCGVSLSRLRMRCCLCTGPKCDNALLPVSYGRCHSDSDSDSDNLMSWWHNVKFVRRVRMHVAVISLAWHVPRPHLVRGGEESASKLRRCDSAYRPPEAALTMNTQTYVRAPAENTRL